MISDGTQVPMLGNQPSLHPSQVALETEHLCLNVGRQVVREKKISLLLGIATRTSQPVESVQKLVDGVSVR